MIDVNYLTVLAAGVVNMVVGFAWYSYAMFAKPWMKEMGYTKDSMAKAQKTMGPMHALSFVVALVMAYVLTHVIAMSMNYFNSDPVTAGLTSAFWSWLGFIMPVQLTDVIFSGKSWRLFVINTGYQLTSILGMGVVLGLMR